MLWGIFSFIEEKEKAPQRGISSAGRAPALHAGGQRFDPAILHHFSPYRTKLKTHLLIVSFALTFAQYELKNLTLKNLSKFNLNSIL